MISLTPDNLQQLLDMKDKHTKLAEEAHIKNVHGGLCFYIFESESSSDPPYSNEMQCAFLMKKILNEQIEFTLFYLARR